MFRRQKTMWKSWKKSARNSLIWHHNDRRAAGPFLDKLQDFLGVPLEDEDGAFYDRNLDEEYISWLKTFNQVYRDGNISDDSFTDDGPTYDEKVKQGTMQRS